ncbi:unnamed protein product [Lupinus luteus]|uniref:Uncharacterized protein n=1 Tax=Lupinus luteus TaxID=3873 RepID=A0AAV1YKH4_LUPLU
MALWKIKKVMRNFGLLTKMGRSQERTLHDPFSTPQKSDERIKADLSMSSEDVGSNHIL